MIDIKTIYYKKFLLHVVEAYSGILRQAKPGHCLKLVGLALPELQELIKLLRPINLQMNVFILSDEHTGEDYIHASKLIELRNDSSKALLALIPANSRTSAEDSYGDATFKVLDVSEIQMDFVYRLIDEIPSSYEVLWKQIFELVRSNLAYQNSMIANYLLFVDYYGYSPESWGNGLFLLGMLPDSDLISNGLENMDRRFRVNLMQCTEVVCNFSITPAERVAELHMPKNTMQKTILSYLNQTNANDRMTLCSDVYYNHPELNISKWPNDGSDSEAPIVIWADIKPGIDKNKELIRDEQGDLLLLYPKDADTEKSKTIKRKISISVTTDPSPKDEPSIVYFEIALVKFEGFEEIGVIKSVPVGNNKKSSRTISVNLEIDESIEEGQYLLRVRALDGKKLPVKSDNPFKSADVENYWLEEKTKNPDLNKDVFRIEKKVAYSNETEVFSIQIDDDNAEPADFGKRAKVNALFQAQIDHAVAMFGEKSDADSSEVQTGQNNKWTIGTLNSTYQFDIEHKFAYQLSLSNKLIALENLFYKNDENIGHVWAELGDNATESTFKDIRFVTSVASTEIPDELRKLRSELIAKIRCSTAGETGLISTFDIFSNISLIKQYLITFNSWLTEQMDSGLDGDSVVGIQNADTVWLDVEMPDGSYTPVRLISPIHPLRLSWMVNICELFNDWKEKTEEDLLTYQKAWRRKLDKYFFGELPMEVAPITLTDGMMQPAYQYVGELTFGWGMYALSTMEKGDTFESEHRQLKAYVGSLLNISREKAIDSDLNLNLVHSHIDKYVRSHPYVNKLVINIFNAGDASVFADALISMEQQMANSQTQLTYELRLFADDSLIKPGEAIRELINPEFGVSELAEQFSQASGNRLFPKLRFSINSISAFVSNPDHYQAHMSFLINPFQTSVSLVRPDIHKRSFFLNGVMCHSVVSTETEKKYIWDRYFSPNRLTDPISETANVGIDIFAKLQMLAASQMSATLSESIPSTRLELREQDKMLLDFVHNVSDWVVTFDKNMGPEFYDLPIGDNQSTVPYLLDYVPGQESMGVSAFLTTRPTSEVEGLLLPHFKKFEIDITDHVKFGELLEDIRAVSSSIILQTNATQNKAFEVLGITLTKRFLQKKGLLDEAVIIPVDLHKDLFVELESEKKDRADILLVNINTEQKELVFTVIEVKCRKSLSDNDAPDLREKMRQQINNTIGALRQHFEMAVNGKDRLDREIKTLELRELLSFYISRAYRYHQIDDLVANAYLDMINNLEEGYTMKFKQIGIIFNLSQNERLIRLHESGVTFFTLGNTIIEDILSKDGTVNTRRLREQDNNILDAFEPNRRETIISQRDVNDNVIMPIHTEYAEVDLVDDNEQHQTINQNQSQRQESTQIVDSNNSGVHSATIEPSASNENQYSKKQGAVIDTDDNTTVAEPAQSYNYIEPKCDITIGKNEPSPQYGILGITKAGKRSIAIDLNECNTISLFGVQGAGKSYTIGTVVESTLKQFSNVNKLPAPLASVIFHYSENMNYAPEFTSMVYPNDEAGQLAKLKEVYGAEPGSISDVILLTPASQVEARRKEYPDIEVHPIAFSARELHVDEWMFLLGAKGNDATYVKLLKQIMKGCRNDISLDNIRSKVAEDELMSSSQKKLANQKLNFASDYIDESALLGAFLKPGRLLIVDLRDEFIEGDEAMGLFVVMLRIFAAIKSVDGQSFNKFIVFDEAHKYMKKAELVDSITTIIREMRHDGVSIMIASQDPMSLPTAIIELSSIVVLHKFSSPAWVKHVQKAITALQSLSATDMSELGSGEAYLWANKSTDKSITQRPIKISIRPRVTKHGGDTIHAIK